MSYKIYKWISFIVLSEDYFEFLCRTFWSYFMNVILAKCKHRPYMCTDKFNWYVSGKNLELNVGVESLLSISKCEIWKDGETV